MAELVAVAVDPVQGAVTIRSDGDAEHHSAQHHDAQHHDTTSMAHHLGRLDEAGVRWLWWNAATARALVTLGVRPRRCWDLGAVHRMLVGGSSSGPEVVWAHLNGLDPSTIPTIQPVDLFSQSIDAGDPETPVGPDGHVRPEWVEGAWTSSHDRMERWARLLFTLQAAQERELAERAALESTGTMSHVRTTAFAESATEVICAELEHDGLPFDRTVGEEIVAGFVGRRPTSPGDETVLLAALDRAVLAHLPEGSHLDLRSPDQVKSLLRRVGIEVPDTRAWRLEALRDTHPVVDALLEWRRAERIRTTFGYGWIDEHVGADGRLRGRWSGSDGSAGRMTATAGLHNMPSEMRPAIVAEPGHVFVRADLGQIEPRVLAAVSGDLKLAAATHDADMYAPIAERLRVGRDIAKVAVLGAMYGQTTGKGAEALHGLEREYPIAMNHLRRADESAQGGHDLATHGGRRITMSSDHVDGMSSGDVRARAAARGRYGRNAIVQGAAAELFKTWAILVRARIAPLGAGIVLCLHDELVIHAPAACADDVVVLVDASLQEAAARWAPPSEVPVHFLADTSIIGRWSDAK